MPSEELFLYFKTKVEGLFCLIWIEKGVELGVEKAVGKGFGSLLIEEQR
jgi:hypothetical protein